MKFIDSHCHIDGKAFEDDREQVIQNALDAGVCAMLNVGTGSPESDSFKNTVELAETYPFIYGAIGIHPHDAKEYTPDAEKKLTDLARSSEKIIAWGEIGLDFYYDHSPREIQEEVFRIQIGIAKDLDLPIIIHSREANDETVKIIKQECAYENFRGGIMHCFGGTPEMAKELMEIGFLISFAGNVTFKKAENLRDSAKVVPLEKLLIETDCPYLTPVPFRGKRNEPARVVEIAKFMAEFYNIELQVLADQTAKNFLDFFKLVSN